MSTLRNFISRRYNDIFTITELSHDLQRSCIYIPLPRLKKDLKNLSDSGFIRKCSGYYKIVRCERRVL